MDWTKPVKIGQYGHRDLVDAVVVHEFVNGNALLVWKYHDLDREYWGCFNRHGEWVNPLSSPVMLEQGR